ncbi:MAG: hypothetical protein IPK60_07995 [Sandaracinaceae bacterium]|nr:hypothetical protein [Sandaracinaceae bacterium]
MQSKSLPKFGSRGLTGVDTETLKKLLRALHRGKCRFPVTRGDLIAIGFGDWEEHLSAICGLDERGAQAVIVAVIAERAR